MKVFQSNGYLSEEIVTNNAYPFTLCIGGRGIGKTYLMTYMKPPILYVRRTNIQIESMFTEETSDFPNLFGDVELELKNKKSVGICRKNGKVIVLGVSMSTFHNIRGIDLTRYNTVVFDEFIKSPQERDIKKEGNAFNNILELVYRNRPDTDQIKVFMFGNSNALNSRILAHLNLIAPIAEKLGTRKESTEYQELNLADRGVKIILVYKSRISALKSKNAFYSMIGSNKSAMELKNDFADFNLLPTKKYPPSKLIPMVRTPSFDVYLIKDNDEMLYISERDPRITFSSERTLQRSLPDLQRFLKIKILTQTYYITRHKYDSFTTYTKLLTVVDSEEWV